MKNNNQSIVAIYPSHLAAEAAVNELRQSGFDLNQLSIVGRDSHAGEDVVGYYSTGDRMKAWGKTGAFWGNLWGLLPGSAVFFIPGIGPVAVAGPVVSWIVGALEGAAMLGGVSVLSAGLVGVGIPQASILKYEAALKADKFLLVVNGSAEDATRAKTLLHQTSPETMEHHQ